MAREVQVFFFMIRWSKPYQIPLSEFLDHQTVNKTFKQYFDKYVFQLENSNEEKEGEKMCKYCNGPKDASGLRIAREYDEKTMSYGLPDFLICPEHLHEPLESEKDNYHYQCWAHVRDKLRPKALASLLEEEGLTGVVVQPASNVGKHALRTYSMKGKTRVMGPWGDHDIYMGQDLVDEKDFYPWQKELLQLIYTPADKRTVHWICDLEGKKGKSEFSKILGMKHDCINLDYGENRNLMNLVSKFQHKKCYLFDLTRCKPKAYESGDLYSAIEKVKNGVIVNQKYETNIHYMRAPHVIVFANVFPEIGNLTRDRWKLYSINDAMELVSLNPNQISAVDLDPIVTSSQGSSRSRSPHPSPLATPDPVPNTLSTLMDGISSEDLDYKHPNHSGISVNLSLHAPIVNGNGLVHPYEVGNCNDGKQEAIDRVERELECLETPPTQPLPELPPTTTYGNYRRLQRAHARLFYLANVDHEAVCDE